MAREKAGQPRRATLGDVARLAEVSTSAVSRTFTPGASVSNKTRSRVIKAAETLGFQPNALARSLMTGRSALIALVSNAFHNPYVMNIIDAFTAELQQKNLRPLVFNLKGNYEAVDMVNLMLQYQIDGLIVASSTIEAEFLERVLAARIPSVIAFGRYSGVKNVDSVYVDNTEGGRIAAREFLKRGYRNMGFIGAPAHVSTSGDRLSGFREVLGKEGIEPKIVNASGYAHAAGLHAAKELIAQHPEIDALFCADDLIAIGAMDALRYMRQRGIPQTGVIGFNDIEMAAWPSYSLATLRSQAQQIVSDAIEMLQARIETIAKPGEERIVKCEFIERGSVRPLR